MSTGTEYYDDGDLLEFLMDVAQEIKSLLDATTEEQERRRLYLNPRAFYDNLANNVVPASNINYSISRNNVQDNSWSSTPSSSHLQYMNCENNVVASGRMMVADSNGLVLDQDQHQSSNYATHHYVPSTSTNFVDLTQYSAKPAQRQDTGYAWRELTTPFVPTTTTSTTNSDADNAVVAVMPPPLTQEYQPECAYCCWLAKGFVD